MYEDMRERGEISDEEVRRERERRDDSLQQPDIPEHSNLGFFFQQYIVQDRNRYVAERLKGIFGWIVYDSAQSVDADRVVSMSGEELPFTLERSSAGVVLLKRVAKTHLVTVYGYDTGTESVEVRVLTDDDVQVRLLSGGTAVDGKVFISYVRVGG